MRNYLAHRIAIMFYLIVSSVLVQSAHAQVADQDNDGTHDANDLCLSTNLNGPVPTSGVLCAGCMGDDQTILGCNASDVLACKPGPNRRNYKSGINQKIQSSFQSQKGWAAKCGCDDNGDADSDGFLNCLDQCPDDAGKSLGGICGCGIVETDSDGDGTPDCLDQCPDNPGSIVLGPYGCGPSVAGDIVEGAPLILSLDGAIFTVPANVLPTGMEVTLAEMDQGMLDTLPHGDEETLITPVFAIAFSGAQLTSQSMDFSLDIPLSITSGFFTRIRIQGGLATDGQADTDWLAEIGNFDPITSQLTLDFRATATSILVAGIARDLSAQAVIQAQDVSRSTTKPHNSESMNEADGLPFDSTWSENGWVVLCDPKAFNKFEDPACDPSNVAFEFYLDDLGNQLLAVDQTLTNLNLKTGAIRKVTLTGIQRSGFPFKIYDPDGRSLVTAGGDSSKIAYLIAWVDPDDTDNARGFYRPSTSSIFVDALQDDGVIIHELMHSVQRLRIWNAWSQNWIIEGMAAATKPFAPQSGHGDGWGYRRYGLWRDWAIPLHEDEGQGGQAPYLAQEFWLYPEGTIENFWEIYQGIGYMPEFSDENQYHLVDTALNDPVVDGKHPLRDIYTDLILLRDGDDGYPHCVPAALNCSGASCSFDTPFAPISASCYDMDVQFDAPSSATCPNATQEITVTLLSDLNPEIKLIVDGVIHEANTPVPFSGSGRIWAMNTDFTPAISSEPAEVEFNNDALCYLTPRYQRLIARVDTEIIWDRAPSILPDAVRNERIVRQYVSFEDLSEQSYLETFHRANATVLEDSQEPVNPLALEPWETSLDSISEWQSDSSVRWTASASASIYSDTDGTSKTLTTRGQVKTLATTTHEGSGGTGGHGVSGGEYKYATKDVSADLTVTWDCTLSRVRVRILNLQTGALEEELLKTDKENGVWECGSRIWTIPANREVQINISATYNVDRMASSNGYGGNLQDTGGSYEIELRANVP